MSQQLINHSRDLKRLRDEGFEIEVQSGYLLIHNVPYVTNLKEIKFGILVSELTLVNNLQTAKPKTHVIYFCGEEPCNRDGTLILAIKHSSKTMNLLPGITVNHMFSNKPPHGYNDYYAKISRYAEIISAPAKSINPNVTERTFKVIPDADANSVFKYFDTNSSRANIGSLNSKFLNQRIAIIGLGGTGAYILDLVAKTPVSQIHLFDGDDYLQHNAFRTPGAPSVEELQLKQKKVEHLESIYSNMHKGVIPHITFIESSNLYLLDSMSYIFISVDNNLARKTIIDYLIVKEIPFLDVGLGVNMVDDFLIGTLRLTIGTPSKNDHLIKRISTVEDDQENEYATNIQIADLNALNAALAVIKWKKMSGFYQDLEMEHHSTYALNVAQLLNEDLTT